MSAQHSSELLEIHQWACDIAGERVTIRRALRMWVAREDAIERLRGLADQPHPRERQLHRQGAGS